MENALRIKARIAADYVFTLLCQPLAICMILKKRCNYNTARDVVDQIIYKKINLIEMSQVPVLR